MIIAVTGHRPNKLGDEYDYKGPYSKFIYDKMWDYLIRARPSKVISGMALGVDQIWANVAINLYIPLVAAIPFKGQESNWPKSSRTIYRSLLRNASETVCVSPGNYSAYKMQVRNEWMVNNCDLLFAVWNGSPGGTSNCINSAYLAGKKTLIINPEDWKTNVY